MNTATITPQALLQLLSVEENTPCTELHDSTYTAANIRLFLKRDDLTHPLIQGNKWRKLKYTLLQAMQKNATTLVTAGGAYSNHILSVAACASALGLSSRAYVRGDEPRALSPHLEKAQQLGMALTPISRTRFGQYFYKNELDPNQLLKPTEYFIPPGGSSPLALNGVAELANEIPTNFNTVCCSVGTGGTLAGIINALPSHIKVIGFASLKSPQYIENCVTQFLNPSRNDYHWEMNHDYTFGGFAKTSTQLIAFQQSFFEQHNITLDLVYTAKMLFGIHQLIQQSFFKPNTKILAIHTGGVFG